MKRITNLFRTADGQNMVVTFTLICTLFLLWGTCNGMIDVLNKHFQNSLNVSKTQSALVQFANYMGYFLMAIPAGLLARKFGYKTGIIIGLVLIAAGAFWFIPATRIGTYWAFLTGLFILATGLTCLETIANPYTTVLGPSESGPTRINLAQSCNGIGWMIGPSLGGYFLLSDTGEINRSNAALYKPYLGVAIVVTILTVIFLFARVPDLKAEEECETTAKKADTDTPAPASAKSLFKRWHFTLAIVAQFLYVAAQTGIFSFFVNYMVSDTPALTQRGADRLQAAVNVLPHFLQSKMTYPAAMFGLGDIKDVPGFTVRLKNDPAPESQALSLFLWSQFSTNTIQALAATDADPKARLKKQSEALDAELNRLLQTNTLYEAQRCAAIALPDETKKLIAGNPQGEQLVRLNRRLLEAAYPEKEVARSAFLNSPLFKVTERGASILLSFGGFALFLIGRFTGSMALRLFKAHTTLAFYCLLDAVMMVIVMLPLGWTSVTALFLSFFFMSIMFPTIFALGIRGLGEHTKLGSSLIVMAIVGGAIMPLLMGWLADNFSMRVGFCMPLICFVVIAIYGAVWQKLENRDAGGVVSDEPVSVRPVH